MRAGSLQPERALRWLDSLDGLAYAARIACAGYWGTRVLVLAAGILVAILLGRTVLA